MLQFILCSAKVPYRYKTTAKLLQTDLGRLRRGTVKEYRRAYFTNPVRRFPLALASNTQTDPVFTQTESPYYQSISGRLAYMPRCVRIVPEDRRVQCSSVEIPPSRYLRIALRRHARASRSPRSTTDRRPDRFVFTSLQCCRIATEVWHKRALPCPGKLNECYNRDNVQL